MRKTGMHEAQRRINHVALVLDGSGSMRRHSGSVIKMADEQIRHLMMKSEELEQETRVSVYVFDDDVHRAIFDRDVMRLPSIADLYWIHGGTALVDALKKSQDDLKTTSQTYGDHAFLTYMLTDGQENVSKVYDKMATIRSYTKDAPENWTVAWLVPDTSAQAYLERCGVDAGSIAIWNTGSAKGIEDVGKTIAAATTSYMTARSTGVRGTKSLFKTLDTSAQVVNAKTVTSKLTPMGKNSYELHDVKERIRIQPFVIDVLKKSFYRVGKGFYQFGRSLLRGFRVVKVQ